MILIKAEQKYIRMSPRKVRLVTQAIKDLLPKEALDHLKFLNKRAALPVAKTIKQAIANAVNNKKLREEELRFSKIEVLPGSTYKRWRPVSRGRAHSIFKRTCHIKVILKTKNQKPKTQTKKEKNV